MHTKTLMFLLALFALGYPAAPAWVNNGASVTYSGTGGPYAFTVQSRDSTTDVVSQTIASGTPSTFDENASAESGQFWIDPAILSSASAGGSIGNYSVTAEGAQTFDGTSWNTITLESLQYGTPTTQVYDMASGLLLQQSYPSSTGAPTITLEQYNIPNLQATTQPPANTTTQPAVNSTQHAPTNSSQPPAQTTSTGNTAPQSGTNTATQPANQPQASSTPPASSTTPPAAAATAPNPCCPIAFLLLIIGFAALRNRV
jgi:cell division septation protein DedD